VPLSGLAAGLQPPSEQANASAIFNIMRNLRGSIGIAMLSTFITFSEHFHFSVISDALTQNSLRSSTLLNDYTQALAAKTPGGAPVTHMQALAEMVNVVRREAFVMAYSDSFFIMGCRSACASWLCFC
jgi:DHA2 family multidrug resistance protein